MATKAIQKVPEEPKTLTLNTQRAADMKLFLEEEKEIRALVREYIRDQMAKGTDYGPMPGVTPKAGEPEKNILFKPGAEKLFDIYRCKPEYRIHRTIDPVAGLYSFEIRCRAVHRDTGQVMNEGLGSGSSFESKYRYRTADRTCPSCHKPAIIKGQEQYGGGWVCYKKKGGCGAKWGDGAKEIEGQEVGKIQNPDLADCANTVLKMAKKRAQVDCAIGLARVSDLFTADLEDLPTIEVSAARQIEAPAPQPAPTPAPAAPPRQHVAPVATQSPEKITPSPEQRAAAKDLTEKAAAQQEAPKRFDANVIWKRLTHGRNTQQALAFMRNAVGDTSVSMSDLTQEQLGIVAAELDIDGAP